ncbi:hypothetical protein [Curtobacterium sp. MCBD17_040]|uniref:hypothetical protein n=1 Tax=Curtobacterium sp. MCBD17_040 TaxID=2175674 RepID=UPI000DA77834|nr:hypothetical protein [Curtobacterium sp. MCBD17_040]WIB63730.1 hypothetical protein DEI94_00660 [Curtobacterium sp. MCBD17_040]
MAVVSRFPNRSASFDGLDAVFAQLPDLGDAAALRRALRDASILAVDAVFTDLETLEQTRPVTVAGLDLNALGLLPDRYADRYDVLFARRFVLIVAEVSRRFVTGSTQPNSVAEEFALSVVLSFTEAVIDTDQMQIREGWRTDLEQVLFEDLDFEFLYGSDDVLRAAVTELGAVNLDFDAWFTSFRQPYVAPYVTDGR